MKIMISKLQTIQKFRKCVYMCKQTLKGLKKDIQSLFLAFNPNKCTAAFHVLQSFGVFTGNRCIVMPRRVARNFWGQGRFLIIRTQILYSSEGLKYMQTLPSAFLKNNYLYQILIILADIQVRAYNFMIKRIPRGFIFTKKNKRCYVSIPIPHIGPKLSRDHQTTTMNLKMYCF